MTMIETASDQAERARPIKMASGMAEKALSETLRDREVLSPSQRVIDYVDRVAIHPGGTDSHTERSAVLTGTNGQQELRVSAAIEGDDSKDDSMFSLDARYPGGYQETIDTSPDGYFCYVFGNDAGCVFDDFSPEEQQAIVNAFFIRYRLDEYGAKPELWQPVKRGSYI